MVGAISGGEGFGSASSVYASRQKQSTNALSGLVHWQAEKAVAELGKVPLTFPARASC
jgi:hypothetical protein